jgi:hypothetical protein
MGPRHSYFNPLSAQGLYMVAELSHLGYFMAKRDQAMKNNNSGWWSNWIFSVVLPEQ